MHGFGSHDPRSTGGTVGDTGNVAEVVGDIDGVSVTTVEDGNGDAVSEDVLEVGGSGSVTEVVEMICEEPVNDGVGETVDVLSVFEWLLDDGVL